MTKTIIVKAIIKVFFKTIKFVQYNYGRLIVKYTFYDYKWQNLWLV